MPRPGQRVAVATADPATVLACARDASPSGRVTALVPSAAARRALRLALVQQDLDARVCVLPFLLADADEERPIAIDARGALHFGDAFVACTREHAAARRLDTLQAELSAPLDLLHCDLHGHTAAILRGARATLLAQRPTMSLAIDAAALHAAGDDVRTVLRLLHDGDYEACDPATGLPFSSDLALLRACGNFDRPGHLRARPIEQIAGMPVRLHADLESLCRAFVLPQRGRMLEDDLDVPESDCELHGRKRRDAEVMCAVAASRPGPCLDLGTSFGRSAFKLATNVGDAHPVFTVNMLPEDAAGAGVHTTHSLTREQIGSYCREHGLGNVVQVFADTGRWTPPPEIDHLAIAFVDACHDEAAVRADSHLCWQRLRPGGVLLWHDFAPTARHRHDWIRTSMAGVALFLADIGHRGPVHHLRGSWIGCIEKGAT